MYTIQWTGIYELKKYRQEINTNLDYCVHKPHIIRIYSRRSATFIFSGVGLFHCFCKTSHPGRGLKSVVSFTQYTTRYTM